MKAVYVTSSEKFSSMWKTLDPYFKKREMIIFSLWMYEFTSLNGGNRSDLSVRRFRELAEADLLILYVEKDEILRESLLEVGAMLFQNKPVFLVGNSNNTSLPPVFKNHPKWYNLPEENSWHGNIMTIHAMMDAEPKRKKLCCDCKKELDLDRGDLFARCEACAFKLDMKL